MSTYRIQPFAETTYEPKVKKVSWFNLCVALLFSFACASYWGRLVLMTGFGYAPELLILPLLFVMFIKEPKRWIYYLRTLLKNRLFVFLVIFSFYSFFYGLMIEAQDFTESYSNLRNFLFFISCFTLFSSIKLETNRNINLICCLFTFIIILYLILILLHFHFHYTIFEDWLIHKKIRVPVFLLIFLIFYTTFKNRLFVAIVLFMMLGYIAYMSNYRLYILMTAYSGVLLFTVLAYNIWKTKGKSIKNTFLVFICILSMYTLLVPSNYFDEIFLSQMDDFKYSQLVSKMVVLYDYGLHADSSMLYRNEPLQHIFENLHKYSHPRGFGYDEYQLFDSGLIYSIVIFGFLGALFICIVLMFKAFSMMKYMGSFGLKAFFLSAVFLILFYLFITADILIVSELGIPSGMALGLIFNESFYSYLSPLRR